MNAMKAESNKLLVVQFVRLSYLPEIWMNWQQVVALWKNELILIKYAGITY